MNELTYLGLKLLWEVYLGVREKRVYRTTQRHSLPEEVQDIMDEQTLQRARLYSADRVDLVILRALYGTVLNAGFIVFNGVQLLWDNSAALVGWAGVSSSDAFTSCVFVLLMNTFNTLTWLPVEVHVHFLLEQKHGFNRLSAEYFAKDRLKAFLFTQLVTLFLTFVAVQILISGGDFSHLYLWLFLVFVFFFVNAVYPDFVAPIFDKFSSLPDGELRNKIETLTTSVDYPINRVFILDSSNRTDHSDAYHVGIYRSKRIVLFDSLLREYRGHRSSNKGLHHDEVLGVVGHELGHWSFNHILKLTVISLLMCLIMLIIYGPSLKEKLLQKDLGLHDFRDYLVLNYFLPTRVAVSGRYLVLNYFLPTRVAVSGLYLVLNYFLPTRMAVFGFGLLWMSRMFELQADGFAGSLGLASHLRRALIKVHRDNLLFPVHDWLYSMSYAHHPDLLDRLRALDKYE